MTSTAERRAEKLRVMAGGTEYPKKNVEHGNTENIRKGARLILLTAITAEHRHRRPISYPSRPAFQVDELVVIAELVQLLSYNKRPGCTLLLWANRIRRRLSSLNPIDCHLIRPLVYARRPNPVARCQ